MFTATRGQIATYLVGVCLFSISFLVFVNATASFVVTNVIGKKRDVGNAVGTLGFADEVVALVACPICASSHITSSISSNAGVSIHLCSPNL